MTTQSNAPGEACVLIVDDELDIRESLRDVVEMEGCSALLVASAEEALLLLAEQRPCLVVLDLLMPGMTGNEMLERIRATPELSGLRVVISTSAPERAPRGVPVLPKPVDIDVLWTWIRRVCRCANGLAPAMGNATA